MPLTAEGFAPDVAWNEIGPALKKVNYDGALVIENVSGNGFTVASVTAAGGTAEFRNDSGNAAPRIAGNGRGERTSPPRLRPFRRSSQST